MRTCDGCDACCWGCSVIEIDKPVIELCPLQRLDGPGCSDYENRPKSCKTFKCAWLAEVVPVHLSPLKCGAFAEHAWLNPFPGKRLDVISITVFNRTLFKDFQDDWQELVKPGWIVQVLPNSHDADVMQKEYRLWGSEEDRTIYEFVTKQIQQQGYVETMGPDGKILRYDHDSL